MPLGVQLLQNEGSPHTLSEASQALLLKFTSTLKEPLHTCFAPPLAKPPPKETRMPPFVPLLPVRVPFMVLD